MGEIYKATNLVTGMSYIGQTTVGISKRRKSHERAARAGSESSLYFYNALRKYGSSSFEWSCLFKNVDISLLDEFEIDSISVYQTMHPLGYNLRDGGVIGRHTEESKRKIGLAHTGKIVSEETKERISQLHENRKRSIVAIDNQKEKMLQNWSSPEFQAKMKKSHEARKRTPKLTEYQVLVIKKRLSQGESKRSISNDMKIPVYTIRNIQTNKIWNNIP